MFNEMEKVFNLEKQEEKPKQELIQNKHQTESSVLIDAQEEADIKLAKNVYRDLLNRSEELLDLATEMAKASEAPFALDVAGRLMKTIADVAQKLEAPAQQRRLEIEARRAESKNNNVTTNNNLMLTTSEDLMKNILQTIRDESSNKDKP